MTEGSSDAHCSLRLYRTARRAATAGCPLSPRWSGQDGSVRVLDQRLLEHGQRLRKQLELAVTIGERRLELAIAPLQRLDRDECDAVRVHRVDAGFRLAEAEGGIEVLGRRANVPDAGVLRD